MEGLENSMTHSLDTIEMGGERKKSRYNLSWHCREAPVSSWLSAMCCHTELRNLLQILLQSPRCGAPELDTEFQRCSKFPKHTEASEALRTPARNPFVYQGVRRNKRKGKTHEVFFRLNLDSMATHTGVRVLAGHANKVRQHFRSGTPTPCDCGQGQEPSCQPRRTVLPPENV